MGDYHNKNYKGTESSESGDQGSYNTAKAKQIPFLFMCHEATPCS